MCHGNENLSSFYCTECGGEGLPVFRKKGQLRQGGHLKNLYCIYCKAEHNFVEITGRGTYTKDDFKLEFQLGRFVDGKRVAIKDLDSCEEDCKYNINGKCWNANHSVKYEVRDNG